MVGAARSCRVPARRAGPTTRRRCLETNTAEPVCRTGNLIISPHGWGSSVTQRRTLGATYRAAMPVGLLLAVAVTRQRSRTSDLKSARVEIDISEHVGAGGLVNAQQLRGRRLAPPERIRGNRRQRWIHVRTQFRAVKTDHESSRGTSSPRLCATAIPAMAITSFA